MYEEVYKLWKNEMERAELGELPRDFYVRAAEYLKRLREEARMVDKKAAKARLLIIEEQNVKRMLYEIVQSRRKKIAKKTIMERKIPFDLLLDEEQNVCREFLQFSENFQEFMKQLLESRQLTTAGKYVSEMSVLRFLKDVPAIVGKDMKVYGPFKAEDVASVPLENAKILIKQGLAERINMA
ncbi:DNA replication complex GINS family protein [Candidatus Bathyarchaeota archaeon]|nr:DNA replication complex GINS family protein [Candidatus Bathyarchaeota archaeon]